MCGCGSDFSWEEFERQLEESEEDEAPTEVGKEDVFSPVRKNEEVEAE